MSPQFCIVSYLNHNLIGECSEKDILYPAKCVLFSIFSVTLQSISPSNSNVGSIVDSILSEAVMKVSPIRNALRLHIHVS